jgi:hypothetical protein
MRGVPIAGLVVALATALCVPAQVASREPSWKSISRTLEPRVDPASTNPCNRGDVGCIDAVLTEMRRRLRPLATRCDHNVMFSYTYLKTTEQFRTAWPHGFGDPAYVAHLDAIFAHYYFDALDRWKRGENVPEAWRLVFAAARDKDVTGVGDMLLGMNAHISRDLPFVLEDVGLVRADGSSGLDDFSAANTVIAVAQDVVLDGAARRFDPDVARIAIPGLVLGKDGFIALVGTWRAESWARAEQLVQAATPEARQAVVDQIEAVARARALLITAGTSYLPVFSGTEDRDRFCRAHRS